jgi:hypothetical protein
VPRCGAGGLDDYTDGQGKPKTESEYSQFSQILQVIVMCVVLYNQRGVSLETWEHELESVDPTTRDHI